MSGVIPPYGERERAAAVEVVDLWLDDAGRAASGEHLLERLVREVAGALVTARAEGVTEGRREGARGAFLHVAERIEATLPALGIRAGRELRALAAELRIAAGEP